jgi:hypothetical protein
MASVTKVGMYAGGDPGVSWTIPASGAILAYTLIVEIGSVEHGGVIWTAGTYTQSVYAELPPNASVDDSLTVAEFTGQAGSVYRIQTVERVAGAPPSPGTVTFDATTTSALSSQTTKTGWLNALTSAISAPRRVTVTQDGNTRFQGPLAGSITVAANQITDWGTIDDEAADPTPADPSVGSWYVRIEGGTSYARYVSLPAGASGDNHLVIAAPLTVDAGLGLTGSTLSPPSGLT